MSKVLLHNIVYDVSDSEMGTNHGADLPTEMTFDTLMEIRVEEHFQQNGADMISAKTGFLVESFNVTILKNDTENKKALERLAIYYKEYLMQGYNRPDAAVNAMEKAFKGHSMPYLSTDSDGDPSHVFFENEVYFFGGSIYVKQ